MFRINVFLLRLIIVVYGFGLGHTIYNAHAAQFVCNVRVLKHLHAELQNDNHKAQKH